MPQALELTREVQRLLSERDAYATALHRVQSTILKIELILDEVCGIRSDRAGVSRSFSTTTSFNISQGDGQERSYTRSHSTGTATSEIKTPKIPKKRRRRSFASTADELVLAFVKQKKNPTTKEINAYWKSQGRGHTADNTLLKLVKAKKLKRTPLVGERGSRYSLP